MMFDKGPDLRLAQPEVHEDYAVLQHALMLIRQNAQPGWALEFGVATGTTLTMIADVLPVIGFDSFKGLPEDWRPDFKAGHFDGVRPAAAIPNTTIVEGLFADTVPFYDWPEQVALVHIDCDLYSSAFIVLAELVGARVLKSGTYVVFDEFFGYDGAESHEQQAWQEITERADLGYEVIGHGREQWAVRVL